MTQIAQTSRLAAYQAAFAASIKALDLEAAPRFITALSGGPHSTALACLADLYARSHCKDHEAIIVNHNIRPDATEEAVRVRQRMKNLAIASQIITTKDKAPETGVQEWARYQRFAALTKLARQKGAVVLVAHHQADQAETVLMRLAHGSGVVGLAGMRGLTKRDAVLVARPMLDWHPDSLVDVLGLLGCDYENDSSNHNSQFERVRMREFLRASSVSGSKITDDALRLGRVMRALTDHLDLISSTIWQAATCLLPSGHAVININRLSDLPHPVWVYRARHLIHQIGGRPYGVSDLAAKELHKRLLAGRNSTLGGCQFVKSLRRCELGCFYVVRELGRQSETLDVMADDDVIFAGCWRVRTKQAGKLVHAGALAKSDKEAALAVWPADIAKLPFVVRRAIPVIITLDGGVSYPHLVGVNSAAMPMEQALSAQFLAH